MALNTASVIDELTSMLLASGVFRHVNGHEPKSPPEAGLTCAVWVDTVDTFAAASGMAATSARVVYKVRLYAPMISEPQDAIDPTMVAVTDLILGSIHADFTLGGTVQHVDLLGAAGAPLAARAGYVTIGQSVFRVIDITVPVIIDNAWHQEA